MTHDRDSHEQLHGASVIGWDIPQPVSVASWLICLLCLSPAVWRIANRRALSLDPIWGVVFLLAVNRLSFLFHAQPIAAHGTAVLLALAMAGLTQWYQRHDH
jgi:hypothetical protein